MEPFPSGITPTANSSITTITNPSIVPPILTPTTLIMSAISSPKPSSSAVHSGISKGASIGIGIGLTIGVLLIIGGMLWFFSFHKGYQDDNESLEIGPNAIDYRRKGSNLTMPQTPAFQNHHNENSVANNAPFPTPTSSLKSGMIGVARSGDEVLQGSSSHSHRTKTSIDYDAQKRRQGFF